MANRRKRRNQVSAKRAAASLDRMAGEIITRAAFEIVLRLIKRRGLLGIWHLIAQGNDYAIIDGRVMVIVTQPRIHVIGK